MFKKSPKILNMFWTILKINYAIYSDVTIMIHICLGILVCIKHIFILLMFYQVYIAFFNHILILMSANI